MVKKLFLQDINKNPYIQDFHLSMGDLPYESFVNHEHDYVELTVILSGTGIHLVEGEEIPLSRGDLFFMPPGIRHGYLKLERIKICDIMFKPALLQTVESSLAEIPGFHALFSLEPYFRKKGSFKNRMHLDPAETTSLEEQICTINTEYEKRLPGGRLVILQTFFLVLCELSRKFGSNKTDMPDPLKRIAKALAYMRLNYDKPFSLEKLAELSGLSTAYFDRLFRQIFSKSPLQYTIGLKVQKSCSLLLSTEKSITDIAYETGFSDSNYFARQFRRTLGITPREFRKSRRMNAEFSLPVLS